MKKKFISNFVASFLAERAVHFWLYPVEGKPVNFDLGPEAITAIKAAEIAWECFKRHGKQYTHEE